MTFHRTSTGAPVLLVIGAGNRDHDAFGLQQIAADHHVVLLDQDPPAWAFAYVVGQWAIDLTDEVAVWAAVTELAKQFRITGVMANSNQHVELAARLATRRGLPTAHPQALARSRDVAVVRRALRENAVPTIATEHPSSVEGAVQSALALRFPVTLRPRSTQGQAAGYRAHSPQEVIAAYRDITAHGTDTQPGLLIQEHVAGPDITVHCVVLGPGEVKVAAITRSFNATAPGENTGHYVNAVDPLVHDTTVHHVAVRALKALGITLGVIHIEMRLTARGPLVLHAQAHSPRHLTSLLVQLASAINLPRAAAALATGREPDLMPARSTSAAAQFLAPHRSGRITRRHVKAFPSATWLERFVWTCTPGAMTGVSAAPHSPDAAPLAHWVVTGPDPETCERRLREMSDLTHVDIDATSHATAYAR